MLFRWQFLLHALCADEREPPLEVGEHVAQRLRPVVLGVELQLHREELKSRKGKWTYIVGLEISA